MASEASDTVSSTTKKVPVDVDTSRACASLFQRSLTCKKERHSNAEDHQEDEPDRCVEKCEVEQEENEPVVDVAPDEDLHEGKE